MRQGEARNGAVRGSSEPERGSLGGEVSRAGVPVAGPVGRWWGGGAGFTSYADEVTHGPNY